MTSPNKKCNICKEVNPPADKTKQTCTQCNAKFHKACFIKKYGNSSSVQGSVFVCDKCILISNSAKRDRDNDGQGNVSPKSKKLNAGNINDFNSMVAYLQNEFSSVRETLAELREENRHTVQGLKAEMVNIRNENRDILEAIQFSSNRMDSIEVNMATVTSKASNAIAAAEKAEKKTDEMETKIKRLEAQQNKLAQEKFRNNITITGISKSFDPSDAFWALVKAMDVKIERDDVERIELLNAKPRTSKPEQEKYRSSTILVQFKHNKSKVTMIKRKRELGAVFAQQVAALLPPQASGSNLKNSEIFFRDHLTSFGMTLFAQAKELQKSINFKFLWTRDGEILMAQAEKTKVFPIRSSLDIDMLKAKFNVTQ